MSAPLPPEWGWWLEEGARLVAAPPLRRNEQSTLGYKDPKFVLGDFLANVPSQYLESLAEALRQDPSQFRVYREVAITVPADRRVAASWSVHRNLRHRTDLLRDGLTVREANALLGGKPIDSKPYHRRPVEERAANVRVELADPEVYAIIERELAQTRAERKVRSRARQVVTEHAKRERELEAELRELRAAKSAFETTVKTELEVNRATQLVHSIGEMLDDLPQSERLLAALTELSEETAAVLVSHQQATDNLDAPIVITGEMVWQDRPARAALADSNQEDLSGEGRTVTD